MTHNLLNARVVAVGLALSLLGCGHSGPKVNAAKLAVTKKVALVGVCVQKKFPLANNDSTVTLLDNAVPEVLAAGLDAAIPTLWTGVEYVPFATASQKASAARPVGDLRVCAKGLDPMQPKGVLGNPDKAYLAGLAKELGVDAVLVLSGFFNMREKGDQIKAFVPSIGTGSVMLMVDQSGEQFFTLAIKNIQTDYVAKEGSHASAFGTIGAPFASLFAQAFTAAATGKEWESPSKPGMTGS